MSQVPRGRRRQAELVAAGVEILSESGWEGLTHRAVATRADANPGLVHYYFNGTGGLRLAVAAEASRRSITALFDELLAAEDLVAGLGDMLRAARDDRRGGRVTTELISAGFDDERIGALVAAEFARGRDRLRRWLLARHPSWSPGRARGTAALLVAAIDGLVLQLLLDPGLPLDDIDATLRDLWHTIETENDR